jgi:hypothetical protein
MRDGVLTAEESYLTYYLLWCLGLHEGLKHAHLLINIDELTVSDAYREEIKSKLSKNGIDEIDFSDCQIPQSNYYEDDINFFSPLEDKVYDWLKDDLSNEEINHIQELRKKYQPKNLSEKKKDEQFKNFARQITQIRAVSRRFETAKTLYLQKYLTTEDELAILEQEKNKALELLLTDIYNSRSWRFTRPFRWFGSQLRLLRYHGFKSRLAVFTKRIIRNNKT